MEGTPPGGEDPTEPIMVSQGYDNLDQIIFYFIVAAILLMLGRYSDQIMTVGGRIMKKASKNSYE